MDAGKKRHRSDESGLDSPESDLTQADSVSSAEPDPESPDSKRLRPSSDLGSPAVNTIQDDLLNILEDSDGVGDKDTTIQDLDSVIRSFEEEILLPEPPTESVADLADSRTELGYLLEASDDELGLLPSFGSSEDDRTGELAELPATIACGFEFENDSVRFYDGIPNYDSFDIGGCGGTDGDGQFATLGGLDFSDDGGVDASELLWRSGSLPAM